MTKEPHWHALPAEEVCAQLGTSTQGLDDAEVRARLAQHGPNRLPEPARAGPLRRFVAQFQNVLMQVLLGAAVVTALLEHWVDTVVIVAVVVINAIVGFIQEGKAEQAMDAVRRMLSPRATVIRNGHRHGIDAAEIVPGDLVVLEPGDRVPADLRIISARGLSIQEAILTGESLPVAKSPEPVDDHAALGDRSSMAFSGTVVAAGHGRGIVTATGTNTEIGRISDMLAEVEQLQTPLLRAISQFGKALSVAIAESDEDLTALALIILTAYDDAINEDWLNRHAHFHEVIELVKAQMEKNKVADSLGKLWGNGVLSAKLA
ncbi:MAG: HAD-IC family P-type ATPase, partial [Elioraea tepidiphila]